MNAHVVEGGEGVPMPSPRQTPPGGNHSSPRAGSTLAVKVYGTVLGADLLDACSAGLARVDRGAVDPVRTYRRVREERLAPVTLAVGAGCRQWHFSPIGKRPTAVQLETLQVVIDHLVETQAPPTLEEIGAVFGITKTAARDRIAALAQKGFVVIDAETARGIRVMRHPDGRRFRLVAGYA